MANVARKLYKLYVSNIPWTVSHNELKNYFNKFGPVNLATVIFDKNTGFSRNYGFVTFNSKSAYEGALKAPQHKLEGNSLNVQVPSSLTQNN